MTEKRPSPEDDPFACSLCGMYLGTVKRIAGEEYCDACQRDIGMKDPLRQCIQCYQEGPEEQFVPIDVSGENEYYPQFEYLCQSCAEGSP